jgi:hypothetical protein
MDLKPKYWTQVDGLRFCIRPLSNGGYILQINNQLNSFFPSAASALSECRAGHVSAIVEVDGAYRMVSSKSIHFPESLELWDHKQDCPLEVFQ